MSKTNCRSPCEALTPTRREQRVLRIGRARAGRPGAARARSRRRPRPTGGSGPRGSSETCVTGGNSDQHRSTANVHRGAKKQPVGRWPGRGAVPGMPSSAWRPDISGIAWISRRVYGCAEERKSTRSEPISTSRPAVHDGDPVRERRHDGEVVADVQRRDVVEVAQRAHGLEHVGLRRHVEAGRRLVEHDHPRPAGERHREPDPLLLPARELVRIAPQERARRRAAGPPRASPTGARGARPAVVPKRVRLERLLELHADPDRGVERRAGILRHVGDGAAAQRGEGRPDRARARSCRRSRRGPPRSRAPRRVCPSSASPTVVLPEPDSPTSPSTSPGCDRRS